MHEIETALAHLRTAWLAGRPAHDAAPQAWRDAVGDDELALLALAGQAADVLTRPDSSAGFVERALLPSLSTPTLPDAHRARFRRLLAPPKNAPSLEHPLVAFVAARGYAAHPADWLPCAKDDWAPDLYAPWLDWMRDEAHAAPGPKADLTSETYESWSWTERRKALVELRGESPAVALGIIAAKAGSEPAERRLRLIELLQIRLSEADADYLETLLKDRSDRIQALARALLARLGRGAGTPELATELAAMVELNKIGLIKRRTQLSIKPLKTPAQHVRRRELFHLVPLSALASALNAEELQLVESAPDAAFADALDFVSCVATTGSDAAVTALIAQLLESKDAPVALVRPLADRVAPEERKALAPSFIMRDADLFETALDVARDTLGQASHSTISASPTFATIKANVEIMARGEDAGRLAATRILELLLPRVGLLLDATGARDLLNEIANWGLSPADPRLDMLHFNAALTEKAT